MLNCVCTVRRYFDLYTQLSTSPMNSYLASNYLFIMAFFAPQKPIRVQLVAHPLNLYEPIALPLSYGLIRALKPVRVQLVAHPMNSYAFISIFILMALYASLDPSHGTRMMFTTSPFCVFHYRNLVHPFLGLDSIYSLVLLFHFQSQSTSTVAPTRQDCTGRVRVQGQVLGWGLGQGRTLIPPPPRGTRYVFRTVRLEFLYPY